MMIKKKLSYKGCHDLSKKKRNEIDFKQQLEHLQRAFTSAHAKLYVYFSIKTYFFILHIYFSKYPTPNYLF